MRFRTIRSTLIRECNSLGLPERGGDVFPQEAYANLAEGQIFELIRELGSGDWLVKLKGGRFARMSPGPTDFGTLD